MTQYNTKTAYLHVPISDGRPGRSFSEGLKRLGYHVAMNLVPTSMQPGDVAVVWTPWYQSSRWMVKQVAEKSGCKVVCAENAWLPHSDLPRMFQVQLGGTNGAGKVVVGEVARWKSWKMPIDPWRKAEEAAPTILVCSQRGMSGPGDKGIAHDKSWPDTIVAKLRLRFPDFKLKFRPHPGNMELRPSDSGVELVSPLQPVTEQLVEDGKPIFGAAVYSSAVASLILQAGIPVYRDGPNHILSSVMFDDLGQFASGKVPTGRGRAFADAAWGQYTAEEIAGGAYLNRILHG